MKRSKGQVRRPCPGVARKSRTIFLQAGNSRASGCPDSAMQPAIFGEVPSSVAGRLSAPAEGGEHSCASATCLLACFLVRSLAYDEDAIPEHRQKVDLPLSGPATADGHSHKAPRQICLAGRAAADEPVSGAVGSGMYVGNIYQSNILTGPATHGRRAGYYCVGSCMRVLSKTGRGPN